MPAKLNILKYLLFEIDTRRIVELGLEEPLLAVFVLFKKRGLV